MGDADGDVLPLMGNVDPKISTPVEVLPKTVGDLPRAMAAVLKYMPVVDVEVAIVLACRPAALAPAPIGAGVIKAVYVVGIVLPLVAVLITSVHDETAAMIV